jgi:hypothetical protein
MAQDVKIRRQGAYQLVYSVAADRSNPVPLNGARVAGVIYVFVEPTSLVSNVAFVRDPHEGAFRVDSSAPFDLIGHDGANALPLDLSLYWPEGAPSVTFRASVAGSDSTTHSAEATFAVLTGVGPPPSEDDVAQPVAIRAAVSLPTPTVVVTSAGQTVKPSTIAAAVDIDGPGAGAVQYKQAVSWQGSNERTPASGGIGAREFVEAREVAHGTRTLVETANIGDRLNNFTTLNVTIGAGNSIPIAAHGLATRDVVHSSAGGGGITANKLYWVIPDGPGAIKLATTKNGTPVTLTQGVAVTLLKHNFLGSATGEVNSLRAEWALRPDMTHSWIFHAYQTPQDPSVSNGGGSSPIPHFRQKRRQEIANGEWDTQYNAFFNLFHRTASAKTYTAADGWISDTNHGQKVGEKITITARATTTAFTVGGDYYVLTVEANRYKLTATPPWDWDTENEVAVTGGGNGTVSTEWTLNTVFRISHEGDLAYPGGYADGRLWDSSQGVTAMTAQDEIDCREMWEHICDLIHSHGLETEWSGDGAMFDKIKNAFRMGNYASTFSGDERECWEYGLPGSSHTGSPNYTMTYTNVSNYIDGFALDSYMGVPGGKGKSGTEVVRIIRDELRPAVANCGVYWAIGELGIWFVGSSVQGIAYSGNGVFTKTNHPFVDNQALVIGRDGTVPSPMQKSTNTVWYVDYLTSSTFRLKTSPAAAFTNFTGSGSSISMGKWNEVGDTTLGAKGTHSAKGFLDAVWDQAQASGYGTTSGKCRYISLFWKAPEYAGFHATRLERYAPGAYTAIYDTRLGS